MMALLPFPSRSPFELHGFANALTCWGPHPKAPVVEHPKAPVVEHARRLEYSAQIAAARAAVKMRRWACTHRSRLVRPSLADVRIAPESGRVADIRGRLKRANNRHLMRGVALPLPPSKRVM